jgi:ribosomal protein S12 methylthiotransferase accessory factor
VGLRLRRPLIVVPGPPLHLRSGEREIYHFDGEVEPWLPELLRQLDGRERIELPGIAPREIDRAVGQLREAGLLEGDNPTPVRATLHGESTLWSALRPLVTGDGLLVVHEETVRPSELREINRRREPWMVVSLQGAWARIGPLFVPGETACWECYRARLASNREDAEAFRAWEALDVPPGSRPDPANESVVAGLVAGELRRFAGGRPLLAGRLLVLDLETLDESIESVAVAPYCAACR